MPYRRILTPLFADAADEVVVRQAMAIASVFSGHVSALLVRPDPAETIRQINPSLSARVIQDLIDSARTTTANELARARAVLSAAAEAKRISEQAGAPGWSVSVREGVVEDVVAREALLSDLTLFAHPSEHSDHPIWASIEGALLNSRRPLIVFPLGTTDVVGKKVVIGWDGSRAASHAVFAALPLLHRAGAIEVLTVGAGASEQALMDRLGRYLQLHGLNATQRLVDPGTMGIGYALAGAARQADAQMLVVGGYGHSRLRELVVGGVTRHLLANASLPVFMAH
jgi:nucleotide-binding universal stress UspA family protein